jgi:hypothetical protein
MTRVFSVALLAAAALSLGGCATAVPPVEVTRFHNVVPGWAPGTRYAIATAPLDAPANTMPSLEWNSYRAAVDEQLQRLGLVSAGANERAPLLVRVAFDRSEQRSAARRSPVSVGVGGSTGSYALASASILAAGRRRWPICSWRSASTIRRAVRPCGKGAR